MHHWAKSLKSNEDMLLLCDGDAAWTKAMGLDCDLSGLGLGTRSKRYAMIIDDNTVTHLFVEDSVLDHTTSSAQCMISVLKE
jgi:peroxiredoxin